MVFPQTSRMRPVTLLGSCQLLVASTVCSRCTGSGSSEKGYAQYHSQTLTSVAGGVLLSRAKTLSRVINRYACTRINPSINSSEPSSDLAAETSIVVCRMVDLVH